MIRASHRVAERGIARERPLDEKVEKKGVTFP
jgi:hypothetical protein